jgi:hypothetical protein
MIVFGQLLWGMLFHVLGVPPVVDLGNVRRHHRGAIDWPPSYFTSYKQVTEDPALARSLLHAPFERHLKVRRA